MDGWSFLYGPVVDWQSVQGVPRLLLDEKWDWIPTNLPPATTKDEMFFCLVFYAWKSYKVPQVSKSITSISMVEDSI